MILAGGRSSRMGCEKLSIEVGGLSLIARVNNALSASCHEVLVVGGGGSQLEGASYVANERPGKQGPLAGIEAGLAAANYPHVFVAAGDMPFLTRGLERSGVQVVVPRHGGRIHPLCGAYDRALLPRVTAALDAGASAVHAFLEGIDGIEYVGEELLRFGDPDLLLMNVNSPRDLKLARREAGR
jgi:molybdopterin-guanine dinucleotide biosynthesis protein A